MLLQVMSNEIQLLFFFKRLTYTPIIPAPKSTPISITCKETLLLHIFEPLGYKSFGEIQLLN
ncbi:hypothetical protein HanIR_Chr03g0125871 [Helianthus annuus]|nr:hypothetical protein HanIR_Chr03g0125871 [Helianthus annuus]